LKNTKLIRLFKVVVSIIFGGALWSKRLIFYIFGKDSGSTCVVLYYHKVTEQNRDRFEKQMDLVSRLAKSISLQDHGPFASRVHHVAITFDDAFRSVMVNALPVLARRGIPATLFVPTGHLGARARWIDDIHDPDYQEALLNESELRELARNRLLDFGSHCISHSKLTHLSSDVKWNELIGSKQELEKILDRPINFLSFPHGAFDEATVAMARKAGYVRIFSISPAPSFADPEEFVTGRVKVDPDDFTIEFLLKVLGAYGWLGRLQPVMNRWRKRYGMRFTGDASSLV
jgi:peptidoglycan/xylan/chitin deacetylase (PgdA/CDA1 family)